MKIREVVDQALADIHAETQHRYDYWGVDMYDGTSLTRGPVFTGNKLEADAVEGAINSALYDLGHRLIYDLCDHQWVDARNQVISTGNYCSECKSMRHLDDMGLPAASPPG
jgi:hypothetical protein